MQTHRDGHWKLSHLCVVMLYRLSTWSHRHLHPWKLPRPDRSITNRIWNQESEMRNMTRRLEWGLLNIRSLPEKFLIYKSTCKILWITMFVGCHRSWAAAKPAKYKPDIQQVNLVLKVMKNWKNNEREEIGKWTCFPRRKMPHRPFRWAAI